MVAMASSARSSERRFVPASLQLAVMARSIIHSGPGINTVCSGRVAGV